jgi:Flp pilus assembly protein TadD
MVAPAVIEWTRGASSGDVASSEPVREPRAASRPAAGPRVARSSERVEAPVVPEAEPVAAEGTSSTDVTPAVTVPEAPPPPQPPQLAASAPPVASDLAERTPDELVARGQVLARRGEHEAAREAFLAAAELDPADPHAPAGLARLALATDEPEDAVRWAERAVALRRRRAVYHVLLGDACESAGDHQRAEAEWRLALELEPDHAEAQQRLAP